MTRPWSCWLLDRRLLSNLLKILIKSLNLRLRITDNVRRLNWNQVWISLSYNVRVLLLNGSRWWWWTSSDDIRILSLNELLLLMWLTTDRWSKIARIFLWWLQNVALTGTIRGRTLPLLLFADLIDVIIAIYVCERQVWLELLRKVRWWPIWSCTNLRLVLNIF